MKFMQLMILICFHRMAHTLECTSFLKDFFWRKNVKSIFVVTCPNIKNQSIFDWRKNSQDVVSVQLMKGNTEILPPNYYPGEAIGIVQNSACQMSRKTNWLQTVDVLARKSVLVFWNDQNFRLDGNSTMTGPDNVDVFYAHPESAGCDRVLVYDRMMNLVMTWDADGRLTDLANPDKLMLSEKVIKGMVSLFDRSFSQPKELRQALVEKSDSTLTDNLMKFSFVLHQYLEKMYNFRFQLHLSEPKTSGEVYAVSNGTGSLNYNFVEGGQFEALKSGSVDVGLFPAELLSAGLDFVEFLPPIATFRQYFVYSSPILHLEPHIVYSQFSPSVWGISVALSLLLAVVSSASAKVVVIDEQDANEMTFVTNVLNVFGAMAQQGLERTSPKLSVRVAHFSLLFLSVMLFIFYNTALVMYTLNPSQKKLKSFEELLHRGYFIAAEDTPYNRFQLEGNYSHPDEWFYHNCVNGWGSCQTEVEFCNLGDGADKVKNNRTAFFGYGPSLYGALEDILADKELNDLKEIAVHQPFLVSTFVRKNFPYKEAFSQGLLLLKEAGITYHEDQTWNTKKPNPPIDSSFVIASLYSTSIAFYLLFTGYLASLFLFVVELLYRRKTSSPEVDNRNGRMKRDFNRQPVPYA